MKRDAELKKLESAKELKQERQRSHILRAPPGNAVIGPKAIELSIDTAWCDFQVSRDVIKREVLKMAQMRCTQILLLV